jgi:hypothetical protein
VSETGLIGLAGLVLFYALIRYWRLADHDRRMLALPFAMAALACLFPINTHPPLYSTQWSPLVWLLIAILSASLLPMRKLVRASSVCA